MATITTEELETYVIEQLASFGADPNAITRDAKLDALDVDSLDMVELGQALYEDKGIRIEPKDLQDVKTVGDALRVIEERAAA